jgi:four helix bundle protein
VNPFNIVARSYYRREKGEGRREKGERQAGSQKLPLAIRFAVAVCRYCTSVTTSIRQLTVGSTVAPECHMEKPFDIRARSFLFALDVVKFAQFVADRGWIMSRLATQLVDAGGSVGANLQEAEGGQTKPDFITKNCTALKEAREAHFWLRLIAAAESSLNAKAAPLIAESDELISIIHTIVKNARKNKDRGGQP